MKPLKSFTVFGETVEVTPLLLLVILAVILRIPSLFEPYWYGDEAIYLTLGEGVRQGLTLYQELFDHKPPLIYWLAAVAGSVFWFRFILLVWHAATIVLFWKLAEALFPKKENATFLAAGVFTVLTTIPLLEGNIANAEIFMIGPTIAALWLLFSVKTPTYKRLFSAGLLFSIAALFKVPAAFDLVALGLFWVIAVLWDIKKIWSAFKRALILSAGFLLPIVATLVFYWTQGVLLPYLETAWFFNFDYINRWGQPSFGVTQQSTDSGLLLRAQILALLLLGLVFLKKRFDKVTLFASLWFVLVLFAALIPGRPYPHYLIQVVPPLSILTAILIFGREKHRFLPLPLILLFLGSVVFYRFYYYPVFSYYQNFLAFAAGQKDRTDYFRHFDQRVPKIYKLAQLLATRTEPQDRIFIWGTAPEVYALSRRLPPTRFVTSFHIADIGAYPEVMGTLEKEKPSYIIVLPEERRPFPQFFDFLQQNYLNIQRVEGTEVWKRVDPKLIQLLKAR